MTKNLIKKGEAPMKVEVSVPEVVNIFKEIQKGPEKLFEMIRVDMREAVGEYLSKLMDTELTRFLGRERYERIELPLPSITIVNTGSRPAP